jgi:hypothetical protein
MIAIDIDSTLYDFATPCRQAFLDLALEHGDKEEYFKGGYQSWVEWRSPADVCGIDAFLEALDIVHSPEVIKAQTPYTHSEEVVQDVAKEHDIFYISARSEASQEATEEWLFDICDYPVAEVICTMEDKIIYVTECQYMIDDRCKTLVDFVYDFNWKYTYGAIDDTYQRKAFGLLFEYNRALTDIPNIYLAPTWAGIRYYLERKGVLNGASTRASSRTAA